MPACCRDIVVLVEQLAQQGLLPVICGTDTLGVGINVPIHTVVLTALTKFDGTKMRRLRAREFHQIAGRAGRIGLRHRGHWSSPRRPSTRSRTPRPSPRPANDPKKLKKVKRKKRARRASSRWNQSTFDKLIDAAPETARRRTCSITHSMVLDEVDAGRRRRAGASTS